MSEQERGGPEERGVYIISVAAELAGVHPQTLRIYERKGLLHPSRTPGNTRRYSEQDIERLRTIQELTQEHGFNLAGVKMIVEMERQLDELRRRMDEMVAEMDRQRRRLQERAERARRQAEDVRRQAERSREAFALVPRSSLPRMPWTGGS